jgi:hypothetical protein
MAPRCRNCRSSLAETPEIIIHRRSFCYRCAKTEEERLLAERNAEEKALFDQRMAEYQRALPKHAPIEAAYRARFAEHQRKTDPLKFAIRVQQKKADNALFLAILSAWVFVLLPITVTRALKAFRKLRELKVELQATTEKHHPGSYESGPQMPYLFHPTREPVMLAASCNSPELVGVGYDRTAVLMRDGSMCQCCGNRFRATELEVHHVLPRVAGGSDSTRNLITLCIPCHMDEWWFGHVHVKTYRS